MSRCVCGGETTRAQLVCLVPVTLESHRQSYLLHSGICFLILLYMCPHTTICVPASLETRRPSYRLYTTLCVLILLYMRPHTSMCVFSYYYVCVLILLYVCVHILLFVYLSLLKLIVHHDVFILVYVSSC
jgi:hypothetical protein